MNKFALLVSFSLALLIVTTADAQNKCSFQTIHARYGATCQGSVSPSSGAPLVPFALLGTCAGNATGYFTCSGTQSFGGVVVPAPAEGQSTVNSDCTGQITYNKGTPEELDINFLILHDGKEIRGMLQNTGTAVQCDLVRMEKGQND
jgi:hypothetical protein